jgi:hypothetical protein
LLGANRKSAELVKFCFFLFPIKDIEIELLYYTESRVNFPTELGSYFDRRRRAKETEK